MFTRTLVCRAFFVVVLTAGIGSAGNVLGAEARARHKSSTDRTHEGQTAEKSKAAEATVARELSMRPLPAYRIAPPDVLQIEVTVFQGTKISGGGTVSGITASAGNSTLGSNTLTKTASGTVTIAGPVTSTTTVTVKGGNAKPSWDNAANQTTKPSGPLQAGQVDFRVAAVQPIKGQYLVAPDGTVNLRDYGMVQVMGKTVDEAKTAVEKQVSKSLASPKVSVDVIAYNSKVYYVITAGAGLGDNVRRIPITGNETVLDALAVVNGLSQVSSKRMWIARPSASAPENGTVLPVDYEAITQRGAAATNYQLMPGDRLFIAEDGTAAMNTWVAKKTTSIERVLGLISLGASTVESIEKLLPQEQKGEKDGQ